MKWSESFDMASIPDAILRSEWARRNARKRKTYSGGVIWAKHNPSTPACRCKDCGENRRIARMQRIIADLRMT